MDQNDGRLDDDIPVRPDELPADDDGHPAGVRGDRPRDTARPVKERRASDMTRHRHRVVSSLREDDATLVERYVPVRIYLQSGETPAVVERAVTRLLTILKVSIEASGEPEIGSWLKACLAKHKSQSPARS